MTEDKTVSTPSSWLKRLQMESWQAELIISGVAIFGVFTVEEFIFDQLGWMIYYLPPNLEEFQYLTITYLSMAFAGLQLFFIVHFILRAFWVALLGLASVYPDGIRTEHEMYSPAYLQAWKADFPDLQGYVKQLDQICSIQLSTAFMAAMIGATFAIWIVLGGLIYYFLAAAMGEEILFLFGKIIIGILLLATLLSMVFIATNLKHSAWAKRYQYPFNRFFSKVLFTVFHRPQNYIMGTLQTHRTSKQFWVQYTLMMVVFGVLAGFKIIPILDAFPINQDRFYQMDRQTNKLSSYNYADQYPNERFVFSPVLPSAYWQQNQYLEFFVPLLDRERTPLLAACDEPEIPETVTGDRQSQILARRLACYESGLDFAINGQAVQPQIKFHSYHLNQKRGIWCYIAKPPLAVGENILTITHHWRNADGERKVDNIPFFYQP